MCYAQFMRAVDNVIMSPCVTPPCVALSWLSRHVNDVICMLAFCLAKPQVSANCSLQCFPNNTRADCRSADWLSARWSGRERRVCTSRWLTESWVSSYVCTCTVRNITNNCHSRSFVIAFRKIVSCSIFFCEVFRIYREPVTKGAARLNKTIFSYTCTKLFITITHDTV